MRNTKAKKILLVDDDASRRSTRTMILLTHGYDVQCVPTMSAAMRAERGSEPDLLLIGVTNRITEKRWLERMAKLRPRQRVGFLLNEGENLCAVQFEGELLLPEEGAADFVSRVAMLLNAGARRSRLLTLGATP